MPPQDPPMWTETEKRRMKGLEDLSKELCSTMHLIEVRVGVTSKAKP